MKQEICPVGCGYWREINKGKWCKELAHDEMSVMRKHLVLYHSKKELRAWGVNRDYFKYCEGWMSRDDIRKTLNEDLLTLN